MKLNFYKITIAICVAIYFLLLYVRKLTITTVTTSNKVPIRNLTLKSVTSNFSNMKYILQWTSPSSIPFVDMGHGQEGFVNRNCVYVNCFVTSNRRLLSNVSQFDVIMFSGPEISNSVTLIEIPSSRSTHQKYVFASIESAQNYGMYAMANGFFNWTWTYRLDSDVRWGYIVVKDLNNNVIGPGSDVNWLKVKDMDPLTAEFKEKLRKKRKLAAWIVSNCITASGRENFVKKLEKELKDVYKQTIDVYGRCGLHVCVEQAVCDRMLSEDYYFYLSLENSYSVDYVTEKLLLALQNNAVPIVYGGANYTKFMPDGIYLNAIQLGIKKLAAKMIELMNDPEEYANYFKWHNHYKYARTTDSPDTNEYCKMCELLNNKKEVEKQSAYWNFTDWWNTKPAHIRFKKRKYTEGNETKRISMQY